MTAGSLILILIELSRGTKSASNGKLPIRTSNNFQGHVLRKHFLIRSPSTMMLYAVLLGIGIHPFLRRKEPTAPRFLFALFASSISLSIHFALNGNRGLWSAAKLTAGILGCFLGGLSSSIIVYRLSPWHPLADYPGPNLAKCSKWYMAYRFGKGDRHLWLQKLHDQCGPWLRIGPNEISVNLPSAVRPMYAHMFRGGFYQAAPQEADALITTTSRAEHASRLIAWNKAFSPESLRNFRSFAEARTHQLLDILSRESSQGRVVNISHWIALWAMDNMGDMSFSGGFETLQAERDNEGWIDVLSTGALFVGFFGQVPWMRDLIAWLPLPGPIVTFQRFAGQKVASSRATTNGIKQDILGIIQDESSGGPPLSDKEAAADASFIVIAGSDTVSKATTALFRGIIGNKTIQARLRSEITAAFDAGDESDSVKLAKLPYLDACVQEVLRLVPPVSAGPPRYSDKDNDVLGKFIPAGTTVSCPTYALHRDPSNFKDPEEFKPERWLDESKEEPHVQDAFIPFAYGPGLCIGKPVALHNMKLITARVLQSFELSFPKGFDTKKYDASYREHSLWFHDPLMVEFKAL